MRCLVLLLALTTAALAGPSGLSVPASPRVSEVSAFPVLHGTWSAGDQARATTVVLRRAMAGATLPRVNPGPSNAIFVALLEAPPNDAPIADLVDAGFRLEAVKVAYQIATTRDRSHGNEVSSVSMVRLRVAAALARATRATPAPETLRPAIARLSVESLSLTLSLLQSAERVGQPLPAATRAYLRDLATTTITGLSDPCRRELGVLVSEGSEPRTTGTSPVSELITELVHGLTVPPPRLFPAVQLLVDRGVPAPDRSWAAGDLDLAIGVLEKLDRKDLPRRGDPSSGAIFERLISTDPVQRIDTAPLTDRIELIAKVIGLAARLGRLYTPPDAPTADTSETGGCDELLLGALAAHSRTESLARSRPDVLREDPLLAPLLAGSAVPKRGQVLDVIVQSLERGTAPNAAQVSLAQAVCRTLPDIRPTMSAPDRTSIDARIKTLAPRYPASVRDRLLTAVAAPASSPGHTPARD